MAFTWSYNTLMTFSPPVQMIPIISSLNKNSANVSMLNGNPEQTGTSKPEFNKTKLETSILINSAFPKPLSRDTYPMLHSFLQKQTKRNLQALFQQI